MYEKAKITNRKPYQSRDNKKKTNTENGIQNVLMYIYNPSVHVHMPSYRTTAIKF